MLIDRARIYVKAGDGGNGAMSFRREKYVPQGGPDGGDGGRGGDIRLRVRTNVSSLLAFQFNHLFKAGNGNAGASRQKSGKSAEHLYIDVAPGTVIYDEVTDEQLADLTEPEQTFVVVKGGKGGMGNIHFKSSIRQTPRLAELGEPGEDRWLRLELRIIADIGIVGLPNAGKSTLLAAASAAHPKIADYPFTTLEPNLGVVQVGGPTGQVFVMADVPGLIEGAAEGAGLGHEFLRHVKRTKALIHVVDASGGLEGRDPLADFKSINAELKAYDPELVARPMLVALNKTDIPEARENMKRLKAAMRRRDLPVFEISAATGQGVPTLMAAVAESLRELEVRVVEEAKLEEDGPKIYTLSDANERAWSIERMSAHHFAITGIWIQRFTKMTNFDLREGSDRFQKILERSGIAGAMVKQGIQPGDVVHIGDRELFWGQFEELAPARTRRTAAERKISRKRVGPPTAS
ncbi:MAG: GTPase ObgE [Thermomicrobiales bacterium]